MTREIKNTSSRRRPGPTERLGRKSESIASGAVGPGLRRDDNILKDSPLTQWLHSRSWDWFPHQIEVLHAAQDGRDVLLCAPTGAGKTLSGFLPAMVDLLDGKGGRALHTLYISPLKALTTDVHRNIARPIEEMGLPITYETRTGDTPSAKRARQKTKPPDILMTTPESLALLLSYPNAAEYFAGLKYIIIDELHAIMHSKRGDLLALGLSRLGGIAPEAQRIGLSATIADPPMALEWIARPERGVIVQAPARTVPDISILQSENRIPWAGHMAVYAMKEVYAALTQSHMSIVFVNTRAQSELIFQALWKLNDNNLRIALHHGSLERELRRKVESSMASGQLDVVVATSSLDLGIDWAEVDLVVQIGAPKGVSRLLQRIGRSNHRLNEPSRAILVPTNRFEHLECLAAIEAIGDRELDGILPKRGGLDVLAQHVIGCACSAPFAPELLYREVIKAWPYRDLERATFDDVLRFVTNGGYALKAYDKFKRIDLNADGLCELTDQKFARQYRMNIGTIVEAPMLQVKIGQRKLGQIEEFFVNHLTVGDTFLFAGQVVKFEGLRDMAVQVSRTNSGTPKIPSYDGGKLPLSTHLSLRVRQLLEHPEHWAALPETVSQWLSLQREQSELPGAHKLLIEQFPARREALHGRIFVRRAECAPDARVSHYAADEPAGGQAARLRRDGLRARYLVDETGAGCGKFVLRRSVGGGAARMAGGYAAAQAHVPGGGGGGGPGRAAAPGAAEERAADDVLIRFDL